MDDNVQLSDTDELNGEYVSYHDNQVVATRANYVADKLHGDLFLFNEAGELIQQAQYQNGLLNGEMLIYVDNILYMQSQYLNGKKNGVTQIFNEKGFLALLQEFKNDLLHGKSTWYSDKDQICKIAHYYQGQLHGKLIIYHNNKPLEKYYYHQGKLSDNIVRYTPDGKVIAKNKITDEQEVHA